VLEISHISNYPVDGPSLIAEAGTFWSQFTQDSDTIQAILEIMAWNEADRFADIAQIRSRWSLSQSGDYLHRIRFSDNVQVLSRPGAWQFQLPDRMHFAAAISINGGRLLAFGQDYWIRGRSLITQEPLQEGPLPVVFYNTHWLSGDLSRFWTDVAKIADQTDEVASLLKAFFAAIQRPANEQTFKRLVAAVFNCPIPLRPQTVERVYSLENHPIIIGSVDQFVGPSGSSAIVTEGQKLFEGQDLFDAVRYWDATNPPPGWVSSLKVYPRYFSPIVQQPLEFSNTPQTVSLTTVNDKLRLTFPIGGPAETVSQFFQFVRDRETAMGVTLAEVLSGVVNPVAGQIPSTIVPLEVLQKLWLSHGATVSYVRLDPTADLLGRVQLLRRAVPPWQSHLVHFEQTVPDAMSALC